MTTKLFENNVERLLALLEDRLDEPDAAALRLELEASPALRAEYEWLAATCGTLEELGRRSAGAAPRIDVLDGVMAAVSRLESADADTRAAAAPVFRGWFRWAAAAALAGLALAVWTIARHEPAPSGEPPGMAMQAPGHEEPAPHTSEPAVTGEPEPGRSPLAPLGDNGQALRRLLAEEIEEPRPQEGFEATTEAVDVEAILAARRAVAEHRAGRSELMRMASLTPDQVRQLAGKEVADAAVAAAAESLEAKEAERILLAAVGNHPENTFLVSKLAEKSLELGTEAERDAAGYTATLRELDPHNALGYVLEAQAHLDAGRWQEALELLRAAQQLESANPYSLQAALHRQEALVASGYSEAAADLLAALTAGMSEQEFLYGVRDDLLDHAAAFAEAGDWATAREIAQSLLTFGEQLERGAMQAAELEAGLEIQRTALSLLTEWYAPAASEEELTALSQQALGLQQAFEGLQYILNGLDTLFSTDLNEAMLTTLANLIFAGGDLGLLEVLGTGEYPELDALLQKRY